MNANQVKNAVLAAGSVMGSAIARALGGWDMALEVLVCFLALDLVSGWLVAAVWHRSKKTSSGALSSDAGFRGIVKKCAELALVWMGALLDRATGNDFVRTAVCLFFIANEGLSILENTAVMGVPYPAFVKNMLEILRSTADGGGTETPTAQTLAKGTSKDTSKDTSEDTSTESGAEE